MKLPGTLLLLLALSAPAFAEPPRVVIDPGHGGTQEGAVGDHGFFEKNLALEIAARLEATLERRLGARVTLTRTRDVLLPLADRVALANREHPDLFISIHANSMPTRKMREHTEGIETFFLSASASGDEAGKTAERENAESVRAGNGGSKDTLAFILADLQRSDAHQSSSRLAYTVHQKLIHDCRAQDRGVQQAPFYVLMGVGAPAILVEVGFISHPLEGRKLKDGGYQMQLADAIAAGVEAFLREGSRGAP